MKRSARMFHARVWLVLGLLLPLVGLGLVYLQQSPVTDYQPVQLEPAEED